MQEYITRHLLAGGYAQVGDAPVRYENAEGWVDFCIGPHAVFAHRTNGYTAETFRDALHAHGYCEVLFWVRGEVQYVSGDRTEDPRDGCVVVIPPQTVHTTRLLGESTYERFVLYFSPAFFGEFREELSVFLSPDAGTFSCRLSREHADRARDLLAETEALLLRGDGFGAYARLSAYLLLVRDALSEAREEDGGAQKVLPAPVREIRRYIETNYASVPSVEALAAQFYYSREYVTRLFRRYYNLSPGEYLEQCRIRAAERRIADGEKIADVCFGVGYRSISAFSAAFRRVTGRAPSSFRERNRNIHK